MLASLTQTDFAAVKSEIRLIQVGETAGATISVPAAVLRSTSLTISGTAGIPPRPDRDRALAAKRICGLQYRFSRHER